MYTKNYFLEKSNSLTLLFLLIFVISLPLSESIKQISFVLLFATFLITKILDKNIYFDFLSKGLFIFLIGNILSIPFSSEPNLALKWAYNIFVFSTIYFVLINEFKSEHQINWIKKFFLLSLLLGLLWGLFIWKIAWNKPRLEINSIGAPNATGTYLGICLLYVIGIFALSAEKLYKQKLKPFLFYVFLLILLIISLILNGSRGMYVGLLSSLAFLGVFFFVKQRKINFLIFFAIILISLSLGGLFYPELSIRIFDTFSMKDRLLNWERSFNCFLINPITGGGGRSCYFDPDNLFLAILSRAGILGLMSFLYLIYCFLKQFNTNKYILALLIFMLVNGIFETSLKHEPAITFIITLFLIKNEHIDS